MEDIEDTEEKARMEEGEKFMKMVPEYVEELVQLATKIQVNPGMIAYIKTHILETTDHKDAWCLFHECPSYWLDNYLLFSIEREPQWSDVDQLEVSQDAKDKILSMKNCDKCKKRILKYSPEDQFARRAIYEFLDHNELAMFRPDHDHSEEIKCKHYLM